MLQCGLWLRKRKTPNVIKGLFCATLAPQASACSCRIPHKRASASARLNTRARSIRLPTGERETALPAVICACHVEPDATRVACPVREKLNGLKAFGSIPFFYLMALARPRNRGDQDRLRSLPKHRSRDRRSGWVRGAIPSRIPLTGSGPKRHALSG